MSTTYRFSSIHCIMVTASIFIWSGCRETVRVDRLIDRDFSTHPEDSQSPLDQSPLDQELRDESLSDAGDSYREDLTVSDLGVDASIDEGAPIDTNPSPEVLTGSCGRQCDVYGSALTRIPWRIASLSEHLRDHLLRAVDMAPLSSLDGHVALSSELAVISSNYDCAEARVFARGRSGTWRRQERINVDHSLESCKPFVKIDGDTILMGATTFSQADSVYVLHHTEQGFEVLQRLQASGRSPAPPGHGKGFGAAFDLSGEYLIIGAPREGNQGSSSGGAYIYSRQDDRVGWTLDRRIEASDGEVLREFGASIAVDGDTALIGAFQPGVASNRGPGGSVYVFQHNSEQRTWSQVEVLRLTSNPAYWDKFGEQVELNGNIAAISAPNFYQPNQTSSGAVMIFVRDATGRWSELQRITSPSREPLKDFGETIALGDDVLLISGAPERNGAYLRERLIFVYTRDASLGDESPWSFSHQLVTGARGEGLWFRKQVALADSRALVLTRDDTIMNPSTGLILEVQVPQCTSENQCRCLEGAAGPSCAQRPLMGDGVLQSAELCDDANVESGDGCSAYGEVEPWHQCSESPSICQSSCVAEDLPSDAYLIRRRQGECMHTNMDCSLSGVSISTHIQCQSGVATEVEELSVCPPDLACP